MTDIKDKLKLLKKKPESRSKSQAVQDAWSKIDKDGKITTREKLEQLISLKRDKTEKPKPRPFEAQEREPFQFTENPYNLDARYGKISISEGLDISGDILALLSQDPAFKELDLSTALFFDLETTGLSGGTGVIPFNIGMGYYRDDKFWVAQYFLGELGEEERMIQELSRFLADMDFKSVVTYNGKAFDMPLLETRFILYKTPLILSELPHLDFLFPARNLWKHKYESCRLFYLAREVLMTGRDEDIPSAEIPWRYFQYLKTGNFELIEPILYHNAEDILSLLGVVIMGASLFSSDLEEGDVDAMDFFGAGKVLEKVGEREKAADYFQRALNGSLSEEAGLSKRKRLSFQYKKSQKWKNAVLMWQQMAGSQTPSSDLLFSLRELAMYFEHKEKKLLEAQRYAEEGYVIARGFSSYYEKDFIHRRERLNQKIRKESEKNKAESEATKQSQKETS
jgi:uncharacterized protein YprB with RNaseH-like and TPR domain